MRYFLTVVLSLIFCVQVWGQNSVDSTEFMSEEEALLVLDWISNLYEHGVSLEEDSIAVSAEVQNLINNKALRAFMYPDEYTWENTVTLLQRMELKRAFWFLINLYPENKELVLTSIMKYDHLFEMDKALLGSFYTYAMVDPTVSSIVDGKPVLTRPDLVEAKLEIVKELIQRVLRYRKEAGR